MTLIEKICCSVLIFFLYFVCSGCIWMNQKKNTKQNTANNTFVSHFFFVVVLFSYCSVSILQERAVLLFLRYASRWGNEVSRGLANVSLTEPARHCAPYVCPCQYIERHLACKPRGKFRFTNFFYWLTASERYDWYWAFIREQKSTTVSSC